MEYVLAGGALAGAYVLYTTATESSTQDVIKGTQDGGPIDSVVHENLWERVQNQDARENGFLSGPVPSGKQSITAYDLRSYDPGVLSSRNLTEFKSVRSNDIASHTRQQRAWAFDHVYAKPIATNKQFAKPLIGLPASTCRITSGINEDGRLSLVASSPFTVFNQSYPGATNVNYDGYRDSVGYPTTSTKNYNKWGEVRMSWAGLQNPWRLGGLHYQFQRSFQNPDKDQILQPVPIAHPQNVFDAGRRPTQVVAPPEQQLTSVVWNRQIRTGRTH
jgi:hypothetical protein